MSSLLRSSPSPSPSPSPTPTPTPTAQCFFLHNHNNNYKPCFLSIKNPNSPFSFCTVTPLSTTLPHNTNEMMQLLPKKKKFGRLTGAVCYAGNLTTSNLQWISTISSAVLMLAKGTAIQKSFLAPLFALQAPPTIISWIKGEYGIWTAFVALLIRLFFFIPSEFELPFMALLLVIMAPYQVMNLRGKQAGAIIGLVIAGYLAFQHFSRIGNLRKALDQGSIVATLAIICITAVSCLLFI